MRSLCGAMAGGVMAVSAVHGRTGLPEGEDPKAVAKKSVQQLYGKPGAYRTFNQIPNRFKEKYSHTLCRELTRKWQSEWLCREVITDGAGIAADLVLSDKDELAARSFGSNVEHLKD